MFCGPVVSRVSGFHAVGMFCAGLGGFWGLGEVWRRREEAREVTGSRFWVLGFVACGRVAYGVWDWGSEVNLRV